MTLEEATDALAAAMDDCIEHCGPGATTLRHLHEEHDGPTPQMSGRVLRRYSKALCRATGGRVWFRHMPGWDFDLEIRRMT